MINEPIYQQATVSVPRAAVPGALGMGTLLPHKEKIFLSILESHTTPSTAQHSHRTTIIAPATQLTGFPFWRVSCARARHSTKTVGGTNRIAKAIPKGSSTRSSRYPSTGTKSGIRSMGLQAYATMPATSSFAYHGVLGSRAARYRAQISALRRRARWCSTASHGIARSGASQPQQRRGGPQGPLRHTPCNAIRISAHCLRPV